MLVCMVLIEAKTGMRDALAGLIERCALESRKEPGCISYELFVAYDDGCKAVLKEAWRDGAALLSHFATPHYAELIEQSKDMRVKPDVVQIFEMDGERLANAAENKVSLMETVSAIYGRRSVRQFTGETLSAGDVRTLLQAGFSAPSAQNSRPCHFVVVDDRAVIAEIASYNPHWKPIQAAPLSIVVCASRDVQSIPEFLYEDAAAATQNILLCAHALHLGAVWCGISTTTAGYARLAEKLRLPSGFVPVSIIAAGRPAVDAKERNGTDRFDAGRVHVNGF